MAESNLPSAPSGIQWWLRRADQATVAALILFGLGAIVAHWVYRGGLRAHVIPLDAAPPIVLYDYQQSRAGEHPRTFLAGFRGYLHVDGYAGYESLPHVVLVGCWAHARRDFHEAIRTGRAPQMRLERAIEDQRLMDQVYSTAETPGL